MRLPLLLVCTGFGQVVVSAMLGDDQQPLYIPGYGTFCHGAWENAELPFALTQELNASKDLLKYVESHSCPYGRGLLGEVTWPQPSDHLLEWVAAMNYLSFIAVLYSYVPYLVGFRVGIEFLFGIIVGFTDSVAGCNEDGVSRRRRYCSTKHLAIILWLALTVMCLEVVVKPWMRYPRPGTLMQIRDEAGKFRGSCVSSCGMPSSHSALAMGWLCLLFLDTVFRVHPYAITGRSGARTSNIGSGASECRKAMQVFQILWGMGLKPWSYQDDLTQLEFALYLLLWCFLLVPVPFMRVVLYDHTSLQAFWGCIIGMVLSALYWRMIRYFQRKYRHLEGKFCCRDLLKHDLKLPCFRVTKDLVPSLSYDLDVFHGAWRGKAGVENKFYEDGVLRLLRGQSSLHGSDTSANLGSSDGSQFCSIRSLAGMEPPRPEEMLLEAQPEAPRPADRTRWCASRNRDGLREIDADGIQSIPLEDLPQIEVKRLSLEWVLHGVCSRSGDCRGALHTVGIGDPEDVEIHWTRWKPSETSVDTWRKVAASSDEAVSLR